MHGLAPIPWLLAATTPSIRYLTLRRLLGGPEDDGDVQAARREMTASGPIPAILAGQTERGTGRASTATTRPSTPAPIGA